MADNFNKRLIIWSLICQIDEKSPSEFPWRLLDTFFFFFFLQPAVQNTRFQSDNWFIYQMSKLFQIIYLSGVWWISKFYVLLSKYLQTETSVKTGVFELGKASCFLRVVSSGSADVSLPLNLLIYRRWQVWVLRKSWMNLFYHNTMKRGRKLNGYDFHDGFMLSAGSRSLAGMLMGLWLITFCTVCLCF